jgi:speckle-type POZ protein
LNPSCVLSFSSHQPLSDPLIKTTMGSDQHLLKVTAQSIEPPYCVSGSCYSSSIGSYIWECCYSNDSTGGVSFVLVLPHGSHGEPLNARFKFSLLDGAGRPVPSRTQASSFQNWTTHRSWEWHCAGFITREDLERPELLDDDKCFTVRCDVTLRPSAVEARDTAAVPPSDLHRHLGALLAAKDGADVTFQLVADGETFTAHRCVLAARSPVFRAQLYGEMKEGKSAGSGVPIPIEDMDAQVFRALLAFIYTDSLPEPGDGEEDDGAMAQYQHLLAAADKYGLEGMKLICQEKLCEHIRASSVATMLALAERHHCRGLKEACFEFLSSSNNLSSFTETDGFDELISTCPDVLKELLAKLATVLMFE